MIATSRLHAGSGAIALDGVRSGWKLSPSAGKLRGNRRASRFTSDVVHRESEGDRWGIGKDLG